MKKILKKVLNFVITFVACYAVLLIGLIPAEMYMNGQVYIFEDLGRIEYVVAYGIMAMVMALSIYSVYGIACLRIKIRNKKYLKELSSN